MSSPYAPVSITGYNSSPPSDDGSEIESNALKWSNHTGKIGDPLKLAIEQINTNVADAFTGIYGQTQAEADALVTPTNYGFPPGDVRRYGADPFGVTDSATAFNLAGLSNDTVHLPSGTYRIDSQVTFSTSTSVTYDSVIIDASTATGAFADSAVIYCDGGDLTALPDLSGDVTKGANDLNFVSSPSVVAGDVIVIHNPTDSSWSAFRTVYKAGEFAKVQSITGSAVVLFDGLYDAYTAAAVDMYKLEGRKFSFYGGHLHVKAPPAVAGVDALTIFRGVGSRLQNVTCTGSEDACLSLRQCFDTQGSGISAGQFITGTSGTDYGLLIVNCHSGYITGNFWGVRHAVSTGGDNAVGNVPNRDIHIKGVFTNSGDASNVAAANHHGNTEFCSYEGQFNGGINPGGDFNRYHGVVRKNGSANGLAIQFTEMLGWSHDFEGMLVETVGDPMDASARGTVDVGGNSSPATADTTRGGLLNLRNMTFHCPESERLINVRNRGSAPTDPIIVDCSGVKVIQSDTAGTAGFRIDAVSGDDFNALYCDNVYSNGMPWSIQNVSQIIGGAQLVATQTWNPASIADGDEVAVDVTVTDAELGDFAIASFSLDITDLVLDAQVTAANTVTCVLANNTGAAVDLASGTLRVMVMRNFGY